MEKTKSYSKAQQSFIESMLSGLTIDESAERAGVSNVTAYKWLSNGLRDDIEEYRRELFEVSLARIISGLERSIDVIFEIRDDMDNPSGVRLRAAQAIIDYNFKMREQNEVIDKLDRLEKILEEKE